MLAVWSGQIILNSSTINVYELDKTQTPKRGENVYDGHQQCVPNEIGGLQNGRCPHEREGYKINVSCFLILLKLAVWPDLKTNVMVISI